MFFGEKLQSVRELNGLSRKELANKLNLSEQAIWQYENQYTSPKFEIVNGLKKEFGVKSQYFYTKPFIKKVSNIESVAYRAEDRESRKKAKMETTFIDYVSYFINKFEDKLNLPPSKISLLRDESIQLYHMTDESDDWYSLLEKIANRARKSLGVETNFELLYKLELAGIYILEKNVGPSIDAYSTWTEQDKPFIVLGNQKKSAVRRNFDLAHELGHLLLHYKVDMDSLTKEEHKRIEKEANDFASFFLLPKYQFLEDFSTISRKSNPDAYIDMKIKYMVSIGALEYRAYKLGLLTFEENRYFYATMNKKKYRNNEPLDDEIAIIRPGKIRSLLDIIFSNNVFYIEDILNAYNIDRSFIESLFGLEKTFLNKYYQNPTKEYFNHSSIVSLISHSS